MYFRWKFLSNNIFPQDFVEIFWGLFLSLQFAMLLKTTLIMSYYQFSLLATLAQMLFLGAIEGTAAAVILVCLYFAAEKTISFFWNILPVFDEFFCISLPESDVLDI